jgi:iron complex transport system substrate-binding protein
MKSIRSKLLIVISFSLLMSIVISGCGLVSGSSTGSVVLVDGLNREVSIDADVERIVSLAPSSTEMLFAVGAGEAVVGRDDFSDYPPEVADVSSIGSTYGDLNTEAIVALEPDLVVAAMINSPEHVEAIEKLGIPVFVLPNPMSFAELYEVISLAGELVGHEADAKALAQDLENRVNAVLDSLEGVEAISVYYEVDGMDPTAPWTIGAGTFQNVLITQAGGVNAVSDLEGYVTLSLEELVTRDPQVMIFSQGPYVPTTVESVGERAGWGEISAVANGEIYGIDANWIDRPGPRLVDALEAMAEILHPESFE